MAIQTYGKAGNPNPNGIYDKNGNIIRYGKNGKQNPDGKYDRNGSLIKEKETKKLKDVPTADLKKRTITIQKNINALEKKGDALTPEDQAELDKKNAKLKKINKVITNRTISKPKSFEEAAAEIYSSPDFLSLSKENQDLVRAQVEAYTPDQLRGMKVTKKEREAIYADAKASTMEEFNTNKDRYDQDYEQTLRQDTATLKFALDEKVKQMQADNAADAQNTALTDAQRKVNADNRIMAVKDLQNALSEASKNYKIAADRKNLFLQNALSDIQSELDTSLGRADEDKILELRQLQRKLSTDLTDVQNNMSQRGMTFSGVRAKTEKDLQDSYEDYMTTAEIQAKRKQDDAKRLAEQQKRDVSLATNQDLQDLVTLYTGKQETALNLAESQLGTAGVKPLLSTDYNIADQNLSKSLYGGITGQLNSQDAALNAQDAANKLAVEASKTANNTALNKLYADYESTYGTDAFKKAFGDKTVGAVGTYAGYNTLGGITGTSTQELADLQKENVQQQKDREEIVKQAGIAKALIGKY